MKRLTTDTNTTARQKIGIAEYAVVSDETILITSGLGSCLGIVLHDPRALISGMIHVMLPSISQARDSTPAKFVDTGIPLLIDEVVDAGAQATRLQAWIAGGSEMLQFTASEGSIGSRNIEMAEQLIDEHRLELVGSDVGGNHGRSIAFDPSTAELTIRTADDTKQML